ncbi:MAG: hypothetical protein Q8L48_23405 [Archangium sp.]|nr:hypothetical protein [Archangium sp.]
MLCACAPPREAAVSHAPLLGDVGRLTTPRGQVTATLLPTGKVLFTGGTDTTTGLASVELFDPQTGASGALSPMPSAHFFHTATVLSSGHVLVLGGKDTFLSSSAEIASFDPLTSTWTALAPLAAPRERHTATSLLDGRLLVAGSRSGVLGGLVGSPDGGWTPTAPMQLIRGEHTASRLEDGKVLIVGGYHDPLALVTPTAELFDPATGDWNDAGELPAEARYNHAAVVLADGRVLIAGGSGPLRSSGALASAAIYEPRDGGWSLTTPMAFTRTGVGGALLPNGNVLVYGGGSTQRPGEVYDPRDAGWTLLPMSSAGFRQEHATVLLPSGEVLIAGGGNSGGLVDLLEVYDPSVPSWADAGGLPGARARHTLTLLPSGLVLAAGGEGAPTTGALFDPVAGTWAPTASLRLGREGHTATLLRSGQVLLTGGASLGVPKAGCELFDPVTGAFVATGSMSTARVSHRATLLPSGKVLVTGGRELSVGPSLPTAELYDPQLGTWALAGNAMSVGRADHFATLLQDGRVLVGGDSTPVDLYDPQADRFTPSAPTAVAHDGPAVTLLPNGRVLLAGGGTAAVEEFDPDGGAWSSVGALSVARSGAAVVPMPGGKVLLAGGTDLAGESGAVDLYDPRTRAMTTSNVRAPRAAAAATRLLDGRALIAGGRAMGSPLESAETFDDGLTPIDALKPRLDGPLPRVQPGDSFTFTGSGFMRPGSHGLYNEAEASFPLLRLERLDNLDARFAPTHAWTAGSAVATVPATVQPGWHLARVIVNGATSVGVPILIAFPLPDAGVPDAGSPDAGSADAGVADAGTGGGAPAHRRLAVGCACEATGDPAAALVFGLLLLLTPFARPAARRGAWLRRGPAGPSRRSP